MASAFSRPDGAGAPNTIVPDDPEVVRYDAYPEVVTSTNDGKGAYAMSGHSPHGVAASYPNPPAGKICGLRKPTFFLLVLLVLVVICAAVGGGVGGSIAVSKAYDRGLADAPAAATEPNSNSTNSRIAPPPTEGIMELDCPDLTDTTHRITVGKTTSIFKATCGVNHSAGRGAKDITRFPAYSFDDCMTACVAWNVEDSVANTTCVLVHFNANISLISTRGGNCWLKSKVGTFEAVGGQEGDATLVEGELQR